VVRRVRQPYKGLVVAGCITGLLFGAADLCLAWLDPLADDAPGALLLFYGPMFAVWAFASFVVVKRSARFTTAVMAGLTIAFATAFVFVAVNLLRVNVFFDQLVGRIDWQNMMLRFRASGLESLRLFVNLDYLRGAPFKIAVATAIGALMGGLAGGLLWLSRRTIDAPRDPLHRT
jgi:hypothetical protein